MKVNRIMGDGQPKIHTDKAAIPRRMPIPHAIDTKNDIASIRHGCSQMDFLLMIYVGGGRGTRLVPCPIHSQSRNRRPVVKIGGNESTEGTSHDLAVGP